MPAIESPLRYPGGKTQLAPFVVELLEDNDLLNGVYAEPFAGGAGLAWRLLLSGRVSEVWLNDIDPAMYAFWTAVLKHTDDLCERIQTTPVTIEEWHRQRRIVVEHSRPRLMDLAFGALYLNRTNRSGIIVHGGVIGGKDQTGPYKIDCRFNRKDLVDKIRRIASYRDVVRMSRLDARLCIPQWDKALPARSLINIDPPYFAKGQELYTNFYRPDDHRDLARTIRKLKRSWMLTYDDVPEVQKLYASLPTYRKGLVYYAQVKRRANELLVLSPRLTAPTGIQRSLVKTAA
jgi:DNA adenine methylase